MTRSDTPCRLNMRARRFAALFLAVGLLIMAAVSCSRPPADPSTPEGALRVYLEALQASDTDAAYALFADHLKEQCTVDSLASRTFEYRQALEGASVVVRRSTIDGDVASVEVSVSSGRTDIGPLGPRPEGGFDQAYQLERAGGGWRLSQPGWPVYWCDTPIKERPTETAGTPLPPPVP